jgi:hypothetical protein
MKRIVLSPIFLFFSISYMEAYEWPFPPFNSQQSINSTLGEYRDTATTGCPAPCPHFHDGVDLPKPQNQVVFSVSGGTITAKTNDTLSIATGDGFFHYVHVVSNLAINTIVEARDPIGSVNSENHLHFKETVFNNTTVLNSLRSGGGLTPYSDNRMPVVNNIELFNANMIGGPPIGNVIPEEVTSIRVRSRARDRQSSGLGSDNTGIYQIGYKVFDAATNQLVVNAFPLQTYPTLPNPSLIPVSPALAYDISISQGASNGTLDAFYFSSNTLFNSQPLDLTTLQDGNYKICTIAADIAGNIGNPITLQGAACTTFTLQRCGGGPDMTPPQITLDPSALQCINQPGSFDLAGIVSDNCSDPELRLDGGSPEQLTPTSNPHEFSFHISVDLDEGPNQFTLYAIDASSQTLQFPVTLNFDTTPPFVQTFLPSPGALNVNPSAPIQAIFNEPLSSGEIVIEGTPVAGTSQLSGNVITFIHGPLPPDATFSARVRNAMDLCGNCPQ